MHGVKDVYQYAHSHHSWIFIPSEICVENAVNNFLYVHMVYIFGPRSREDLLFEILQSLFRIHQMRLSIKFVWIPAHVGTDGNEKVAKVAKLALKSRSSHINVNISKSKSETKVVIKGQIRKMCQNV